MKQQITYEQWNELTKKQKEKYLDEKLEDTEDEFDYYQRNGFFDISEMIEFLGDSLEEIKTCAVGYDVILWKKPPLFYNEIELVDALWKAVKSKL